MKKIITVVCIMCMILSTMPLTVFSQDHEELEKMIQVCKQKFQISKEYDKFDYDVYTSGEERIWNFSWKDTSSKKGSIEISMNNKEEVLSYYMYKYEKQDQKKLPKYSKEEGKKIADDFIQKLDLSLLNTLEYEKETNTNIQPSYVYHYIRKIHDILFYENDVRIEVDSQTGEVKSFYKNWEKDLAFPSTEGKISLKQAQEYYKEKVGLELVYRYSVKNQKPYLVYQPKYLGEYGIDAYTGARVKIYQGVFYQEDGAARQVKSNHTSVALSKEEIKAIQGMSHLMDQKEAEELARNTSVLGLNDGYKLDHASLNKNWMMKNDVTWSLYFKTTGEEDSKYVNVSIDAKSGKIKSFYLPNPTGLDKEKPKWNKEDSKKQVEKFLKDFIKDRYSQIEYDTTYEDLTNQENEKMYTFTYTRKVGNVLFKDNCITVSFDAVDGTIKSFNMDWFLVKFPSKENVVDIHKVYEVLYDTIGFEPTYIKDTEGKRRAIPESEKVRLVYTLKDDEGVAFDAKTLKRLHEDGSVFEDEVKLEYKDIKHHKDEKIIKSLAQIGIGFDEDTFRPDQKIKQKEFFMLFIKTLHYYSKVSTDQKDIDHMYTYLIRQGILKENEKKPLEYVSKEEAIKYMIRALGYEKIANMSNIYKYPFKDDKEVSKDLVGHVSIAYGLGIVIGENGYLYPKQELTRGDTANMIYWYLKM